MPGPPSGPVPSLSESPIGLAMMTAAILDSFVPNQQATAHDLPSWTHTKHAGPSSIVPLNKSHFAHTTTATSTATRSDPFPTNHVAHVLVLMIKAENVPVSWAVNGALPALKNDTVNCRVPTIAPLLPNVPSDDTEARIPAIGASNCGCKNTMSVGSSYQ